MKQLRGWIPYILLFVCSLAGALYIRANVMNIYIDGRSMEPTYHDGESGFAIKHSEKPRRYDVVIIENEHTNGSHWIKRVIGLPGETVEYRDGYLFVDGHRMIESYLDPANGKTEDFGPVSLEDDEYWVMGDNRRVSADSRVIGPVRENEIAGGHVFILVHKGKDVAV